MIKHIIIGFLVMVIILFTIYYYFPFQKIPAGILIDKIVVLKSKHRLLAYSKGQLIVIYPVAIGKNPLGDKLFEGDGKTPEGLYSINAKNANSGFHKNLGISYPSKSDIEDAKKLGKPTGSNIKIHGLKNGKGYIGRFHRWTDWTNGCIALCDDEIDELYAHTVIGATIEIRK